MLASACPRGAVGSCHVPCPAVGSPAWLRVCRCVLECRAPLRLRTSCLGASRTAWKDEGAGESARREERSPWQKMYMTVLGKWLPVLVCQLCFTEGMCSGWTGQSIWKSVNNTVTYCGTQIRLLCIYICKIHISFKMCKYIHMQIYCTVREKLEWLRPWCLVKRIILCPESGILI